MLCTQQKFKQSTNKVFLILIKIKKIFENVLLIYFLMFDWVEKLLRFP